MTYNKTKRCRSNCGKTKSGRKKRSTSKKMSKTKKKGGRYKKTKIKTCSKK